MDLLHSQKKNKKKINREREKKFERIIAEDLPLPTSSHLDRHGSTPLPKKTQIHCWKNHLAPEDNQRTQSSDHLDRGSQTYSHSVTRTERHILWRTLSIKYAWYHQDDHLVVPFLANEEPITKSYRPQHAEKHKLSFQNQNKKKQNHDKKTKNFPYLYLTEHSRASLYHVWDSVHFCNSWQKLSHFQLLYFITF
jgi:hypothetical protein